MGDGADGTVRMFCPIVVMVDAAQHSSKEQHGCYDKREQETRSPDLMAGIGQDFMAVRFHGCLAEVIFELLSREMIMFATNGGDRVRPERLKLKNFFQGTIPTKDGRAVLFVVSICFSSGTL